MVWRSDLGFGLNGMTITLAPREDDGEEQVSRQQEYERQINQQHSYAPDPNEGVPEYTEENVTPDEWDPVNPFSNAAAVDAARSPPPAYQSQSNLPAPAYPQYYDAPARSSHSESQTYTHQVADRYRYSLAQREEAVLYDPYRNGEARSTIPGQRDPSVLMESREARKYRKAAQKQYGQQQRGTGMQHTQQQYHQRGQGLTEEDIVVPPRPEGGNQLLPESGTASGYFAGDRRSMNFLGNRNVGTLDV